MVAVINLYWLGVDLGIVVRLVWPATAFLYGPQAFLIAWAATGWFTSRSLATISPRA